MRRNKKIALILKDTLRSCGLQSLLVDYFQPVEITPFPTLESLQANGTESFDYYFTDAEQFTEGADYFLPRRSKTVIVVSHGNPTHSGNALQCLATDLTPEQLIEQLQQILKIILILIGQSSHFRESFNIHRTERQLITIIRHFIQIDCF